MDEKTNADWQGDTNCGACWRKHTVTVYVRGLNDRVCERCITALVVSHRLAFPGRPLGYVADAVRATVSAQTTTPADSPPAPPGAASPR